MKTAIIISIFAAGLLLASGVAWAKQQCEQYGNEHRGGRMVEMMAKRLELTENQQAKLEEFADKMRSIRGQEKGGRQEERQELMGLLDSATLNRERALELLEERHQESKTHMQGMVDAFADFSDTLDATQREKLKEIVTQRMEHHQGGRGYGRHGWKN